MRCPQLALAILLTAATVSAQDWRGELKMIDDGSSCHPERSEGSVWVGGTRMLIEPHTHTDSSLRSE